MSGRGNIRIYEYDLEVLTESLNMVKDKLIQRLNQDYGFEINPAEYVVIPKPLGMFGRYWDKMVGHDTNNTRMEIIRVIHERKEF